MTKAADWKAVVKQGKAKFGSINVLVNNAPRGHTIFAYVIGGNGPFCQQSDPYSYEAVGGSYFDMKRERLIGDGHLVFFDDGDAVYVLAEAEPVRFLLISGKPIREPIAWHGPIVMNTQEERRIALEELARKTFIKDRG